MLCVPQVCCTSFVPLWPLRLLTTSTRWQLLFPQPRLRSRAQLSHRRALHRAGGQAVQERLPVAFTDHTLVEDGDNAAFRTGADQPVKALAEAQDGIRDGELVERVFKRLVARRVHR